MSDRSESGFAIVLALIFTILLYILVAELSVSGQMVRATGENDALLARMRNQMLYQLVEAQDKLLTDMQGAAAAEGGEGAGPMGALPGSEAGPGSALPGAEGEGEGAAAEDPSASCDSSRDSWFNPIGETDNDLTTYTFVEDENRKLNILALWSPDEDFAQLAHERLVRLIDCLREDSEFDVSMADAEMIVSQIKDWAHRGDTDAIPRPLLKSDDPKAPQEVTIPLQLDELLLLPAIKEELFYDVVLDGKVYLGLESVLTIWTSLKIDPGNPEKVARQRATAEARGEEPPPEVPGGTSGTSGESGGEQATPVGSGEEPLEEPFGQGIRININTASRAVLRSLMSSDKISDRVIDAIIRYRNEVDEEAMEAEQESEPTTDISDFGDLRLGSDQKLKFFATVADLEKVEEFEELADPQIKADFQAALTVNSEVFSIHLATLFKRSEENRVYVLRRARAIVLRMDDGADGKIVPLVPFEERSGLRLQPVDLQEDRLLDLSTVYMDMDQFAAEDRAWNPFLIDFYLPRHLRDEFYQPR
ncbi:MAG: general secretion pathway protein GspK [Planctomycetes bacterium]|nr:general secretion pathway protein GspK [Planctomycetota bacterium]